MRPPPHASNVYCWRALAARSGAEVATVPWPDDGDWTGAALAAIDERAAIVAITSCHWSGMGVLDVARIGARAREVGAAYVIDGTQSVGAMPFDVTAVRPDFLVVAAYKWLFCPYNLAFLYAAPDRQAGEPIERHGYNRAGARQAASLWDYAEAFEPGARRYDMGERSNFSNLPVAAAGLDQVLAWGVESIAGGIRPLVARLAEGAAALGLKAPPPAHRAPHMIGLASPRPLPAGLMASLAARNIHVSRRGDIIRVSPHLYNTPADVDRLLSALAELLRAD